MAYNPAYDGGYNPEGFGGNYPPGGAPSQPVPAPRPTATAPSAPPEMHERPPPTNPSHEGTNRYSSLFRHLMQDRTEVMKQNFKRASKPVVFIFNKGDNSNINVNVDGTQGNVNQDSSNTTTNVLGTGNLVSPPVPAPKPTTDFTNLEDLPKPKALTDEDDEDEDRDDDSVNVCLIITCVLFILLNIGSIAAGAIMIGDCPIDENIPIFLVVSGCAWCIMLACLSPMACKKGKKFKNRGMRTCEGLLLVLFALLYVFAGAWHIAGSVWIFTRYPIETDSPWSRKYCNKSGFLFAFAYTIIMWFPTVLLWTAGCC